MNRKAAGGVSRGHIPAAADTDTTLQAKGNSRIQGWGVWSHQQARGGKRGANGVPKSLCAPSSVLRGEQPFGGMRPG